MDLSPLRIVCAVVGGLRGLLVELYRTDVEWIGRSWRLIRSIDVLMVDVQLPQAAVVRMMMMTKRESELSQQPRSFLP